MHVRRALAPALLATALTGVLASQTTFAQTAPAATQAIVEQPGQQLTPEAMEVFLLTAKVTNKRDAGKGVTGSRRATFTDGVLTHEAHIQVVDVTKPVFEAGGKSEVNFKDSYRFNIAGYKIARLVGLDNVPMSVARKIDDKMAAVTWWIDDVLMDEQARVKKKVRPADADRQAKQWHVMAVWDELVQNKDRNATNIVYTTDWKLWLIDHSRAFRTGTKLEKPALLNHCERSLLDGLRGVARRSRSAARRVAHRVCCGAPPCRGSSGHGRRPQRSPKRLACALLNDLHKPRM